MSKQDKRSPDEVLASNMAHFIENGPGLSSAYSTFIVARDRAHRYMLVGGLGGMGVGEMWMKDAEPDNCNRSGYAEAPEAECPAEIWDDELRAATQRKEAAERERSYRQTLEAKASLRAGAKPLPADAPTTAMVDNCEVCGRTGPHNYLFRCQYCTIVGDNKDAFAYEDEKDGPHNGMCYKCAEKMGIAWIWRNPREPGVWLNIPEPECTFQENTTKKTISCAQNSQFTVAFTENVSWGTLRELDKIAGHQQHTFVGNEEERRTILHRHEPSALN